LMAEAAITRRREGGAVVARPITDRPLLREFLEGDRLFAAYAICDLEDREFGKTRWGAAWAGDSLIAVVLEYAGFSPQPLFVMGEGVYYGFRVGGRLVSAAGTHVISPSARLAVVGNVLTHASHRGRGFATATTGAVTAELLRFCDQVVLNVRSDNPAALQ